MVRLGELFFGLEVIDVTKPADPWRLDAGLLPENRAGECRTIVQEMLSEEIAAGMLDAADL